MPREHRSHAPLTNADLERRAREAPQQNARGYVVPHDLSGMPRFDWLPPEATGRPAGAAAAAAAAAAAGTAPRPPAPDAAGLQAQLTRARAELRSANAAASRAAGAHAAERQRVRGIAQLRRPDDGPEVLALLLHHVATPTATVAEARGAAQKLRDQHDPTIQAQRILAVGRTIRGRP